MKAENLSRNGCLVVRLKIMWFLQQLKQLNLRHNKVLFTAGNPGCYLYSFSIASKFYIKEAVYEKS